MREVDRDGLVEAADDPMVHHHLDLSLVVRAWVDGPAVVVQHRVGWSDAPPGALAAFAVGPADHLGLLLASVAERWPDPWRVVVEEESAPALPPGWVPAQAGHWQWMTTSSAPPTTGPPGPEVVDVTDPADVAALFEVAGRSTFARPDDRSIAWVGARAGDRADDALVAIGGLTRMPSGSGHLRGIATAPAARGRGLATAVTAELTRRAVAGPAGLASLGVFSDNDVALGVYHRLGFRTRHAFVSGLTTRAVM